MSVNKFEDDFTDYSQVRFKSNSSSESLENFPSRCLEEPTANYKNLPGSSPHPATVTGNSNISGNVQGESSRKPIQRKKIRLRAAETESDYFINLIKLKISFLRKLLLCQIATALIIVITEIFVHALFVGYTTTEFIIYGLWFPILVFAPTCWLTYISITNPSHCCLKTTMVCHIISVLAACLLIALSGIFLPVLGDYIRVRDSHEDDFRTVYDPQVPIKVCVSIMIIAGICQAVMSVISAIQYGKIAGCGMSQFDRTLLFDVETVAI